VTFACRCRRRSVIITIITIIIIIVIYFHSYKNEYKTKWQFKKENEKKYIIKKQPRNRQHKWMISGVLLLLFFFFNLGTIVTQMSRFATIILVQKIGNHVPIPTKEYHISCVQLRRCSVRHIHARGELVFYSFSLYSFAHKDIP